MTQQKRQKTFMEKANNAALRRRQSQPANFQLYSASEMAAYNQFLNNLITTEKDINNYVISSQEPELQESIVKGLIRGRPTAQQLIPDNICSANFMQAFAKHIGLLGSLPQFEFSEIQPLPLFQKYHSYSAQEIRNRFFKSNIYTQKNQHLQRLSSTNRPLLQWPNLQKIQTYDLSISNKDPESNSQIQIKRQDLLRLKENKVIPQRIITNFFTLLRQTNRLAQGIQIAPFSFMNSLLTGLSQDEQNETVILGTVAKNYRKAAKCLKSSLYQQQYTAIPIFEGGHYSMMLVKGMCAKKREGSYQPNLIYCSSRYLAAKELFSVMKAYLQCEARDFKEEVTLNVRNVCSTQLLLPRQVLAEDSGLFLMLCCQSLLTAGNERQLSEIVPGCFNSKLHIFPASLVYQMRAFIWNFYCKMASLKSKGNQNGNKLNVVEEYFSQIKAFEAKASFQEDYCQLDASQVAKWSLLIGQKAYQSEEELLNLWALEYFYNQDLNYYEAG